MSRLTRTALLRGSVASAALLAACADDQAPTGPTVPSPAVQAAVQPEIALAPQNRVIVRFRQGSAPGQAIAAAARQRAAEAFAARHAGRVSKLLLLPRTVVLEVEPGTEAAAVARLAADPEVEFAERDELIMVEPCETGLCESADDTFRGYKWDLHNTGSIFGGTGSVLGPSGTVDADIDWLEAYDALGPDFQGTATIGIIDSGIHPTHVEFAGRIVAARNFALGYPADLIADRDSHGTHVAGIAAAPGNNGLGVAGVAFGANIKLISAKSCERYLFPDGIVRTSCPTSSTAEAIVWATDQGAQVLNLSLGGSPLATSGPAVQQAAFQYARAQGVLPFCATGNDGVTTSIAFPARFPECIAVAATNWLDERTSYSNAGPGVELAAPGGDGLSRPANSHSLILSASNAASNSSYSWKAGTSMATPQVAGLAALLIASGVPADEVVERMKATADDLDTPGNDTFVGAGRINACRALDPAAVRVGMPGAVTLRAGTSAIIPVTLFGGPRFTVNQFDAATLSLGDGRGTDASVAVRGDAFRSAIEDVDGDGVLDLTLKFDRDAVAAAGDLNPGQRALVVRGSVGCRRVEGSQTVKVNR